MTTIVVLFNLKAGVDAAAYERWARAHDAPTVNGLPSVREFRVLRTSTLLSGAPAPYQYVELIELASLPAFREDVKVDAVQNVARQFREFAEAPQFIVTESL